MEKAVHHQGSLPRVNALGRVVSYDAVGDVAVYPAVDSIMTVDGGLAIEERAVVVHDPTIVTGRGLVLLMLLFVSCAIQLNCPIVFRLFVNVYLTGPTRDSHRISAQFNCVPKYY